MIYSFIPAQVYASSLIACISDCGSCFVRWGKVANVSVVQSSFSHRKKSGGGGSSYFGRGTEDKDEETIRLNSGSE